MNEEEIEVIEVVSYKVKDKKVKLKILIPLLILLCSSGYAFKYGGINQLCLKSYDGIENCLTENQTLTINQSNYYQVTLKYSEQEADIPTSFNFFKKALMLLVIGLPITIGVFYIFKSVTPI